MTNPVRQTLMSVISQSTHVSTNERAVDAYVESLGSKDIGLPDWKVPVFLDENTGRTMDFFFLGNSINFAYNNFETGTKFRFFYKGKYWEGAFGMWAALKDAVEGGELDLGGEVITLNGRPLSEIRFTDLEDMLQEDSDIPLLNERFEILREIGRGLESRFHGHISNLIYARELVPDDAPPCTCADLSDICGCERRTWLENYWRTTSSPSDSLFGPNGIIDEITTVFPSFQDSAVYKGSNVYFLKRAQLAIAMIYERFRSEGRRLFTDEDVNEFTVFADYELPPVLNSLEILSYDENLERRIQSGVLIEAGSEEEVEFRAHTIYGAELVKDRVNATRASSDRINALNTDYLLWQRRHEAKGKKAPLVVTTKY